MGAFKLLNLSFSVISWILFCYNDFVLKSCAYSSGGSEGLFAQKTLEISDEILATYKNQGKSDTLVKS